MQVIDKVLNSVKNLQRILIVYSITYMYGILLGLYLIVTAMLVLVILFQKSSGMALQAKTNMGPRMRGNPLTKLTGILAVLFITLCLQLTRNVLRQEQNTVTSINSSTLAATEDDVVS